MSLANKSLFEGESFPRRCSVVEQASIRVWAMTDRQESMAAGFWMSSKKSGFCIKLTQNRNGKQFDFHELTTSGSAMSNDFALLSKISNNHLTGDGTPFSQLRIVVKKSSMNFCSVPFVDRRRVRKISGIAFWARSPLHEKNDKLKKS